MVRSVVLMQMFDMGVSGVGPVGKLSEMTNVMPSADKGTFAAPAMQLFCSMVIHLISTSILISDCCLRLLFQIVVSDFGSCDICHVECVSQALLSSIVALICQATSPCAFPNGYGRSRPETRLVYLHRAESSRLNNSVDSSHSPIRVLLHPSHGSHCRRKKSVSLQSACQCSTSSCHQAACCSVQCDQQERNNSSCSSRPEQVHSTLHLLWVLAQLSHAAHSRHAFKSGHLHPRETGFVVPLS